MLNHLYKLSYIFLIASISDILKSELSIAKGWDSFEKILNKHNFSIGESFGKDKYYLKQDGKNSDGAYLRGNHEKLQIIEDKPKIKKRRVPKDAQWSWAAKYEREESDINDADLTNVFTQYNVSPDIQQFLSNIPEQDLGMYLPLVRKKPQITLQELQSIEPIEKKKVKEPEYTKAELAHVENLQEPYKTWALIQFRKLRLWAEKHNDWYNYSLFQIRLAEQLPDWFRSEQPQISSYSWKTAIEASDAWHKEMAQDGEGKSYIEGNANIVYGPKWKNKEWNGWTIKQIKGANDLKVEGNLMDNCVGGYAKQVESGEMAVYSLRDPQNKPHATPGEDPAGSHYFIQLLGVGNSELKPEYKQMLGEWFKTLGNASISGSDDAFWDDLRDFIYQLEQGYKPETVMEFLDKPDDYGLPTQLPPDAEIQIFENIVKSAEKNKNKRNYNVYLSSIENLVNKAIEEIDQGYPEIFNEIYEYCTDYIDSKSEDYFRYSDDNYSEYAKHFNKADYSSEDEWNEAIEEAIANDYNSEFYEEMSNSLVNRALEIMNEERRNRGVD
jgi:hypothetical protein